MLSGVTKEKGYGQTQFGQLPGRVHVAAGGDFFTQLLSDIAQFWRAASPDKDPENFYGLRMGEEDDNIELFQLSRVASATKICLSAFSNVSAHQTLALILECGDVLFCHNLSSPLDQLTFRCIPWHEDPQKRIEAATFDPTSGNWLLVACNDGSMYLLPTQLQMALEPLDPEWPLDDVTLLPPLCGLNNVYDFYPSAVAWWDRTVGDCRYQSIVIIGGRRGEIVLANLRTGCVVGHTAVEGVVTTIQVCKDDTLLDLPPVFLLISNENNVQWKLVLEDRESGYIWPMQEQSRADSSMSLMSGVGLEESVSRPSLTSFPLARARLQGLKQLSVEKLATLRQKLSETRSRGIVNVTVKRRGSSSSEESVSRQRSSVSSDSESLSGGGNSGPRLDMLTDTSLCLQMARGKPLIVGHYAPAHLVTVYGVGLNMSPMSVHRLPAPCQHICLSDWLLYTSDLGRQLLSIVSYRLSQCRMDGDKQILNSDVNPDSLLQQFQFGDGEEIRALYRLTPNLKDYYDKMEDTSHRKRGSHRGGSKGGGAAEQSTLDQCAVVTNRAVYKVVMRKSPREVVFTCVMNPNKIEKAERLCYMFGLDLQQLLETAAERQLEAGHLESALALYKLARCRPVKSVLHMASAGFTHHLLTMTTGLLQTTQLSQAESLHLANLSVLTFTEQSLRAKQSDKVISLFRNFLRDNHHYDEVLAASVVGQSGLCTVLEYLCDERGLATQVLDVLARVINSQHTPVLNCELCDGFWECMSSTTLCQALAVNPDIAKLHISFVQARLPSFSQNILQRFANLYDPSQPPVRPALQKLMLETIDVKNGGNIAKGDGPFPLNEWLACYLLTCVHLGCSRSRAGKTRYSPDLMVDLPTQPDQDQQDAKDIVSTPPSVVSAGFTHVGLVRNCQLYTWGYTANGCLGVGPTLTQTQQPKMVPLFPALGVQVLSVACGKLHTLALTSNGVYAWGSSKYGQLGIGPTGQSVEPRLVERLYGETVVSVVAGQYHSLALSATGRVYSWGWGVHGQLGHGNVEDYHYPAIIQSLISETIVSLGGGHAHSLMLSTSGRVWACGSSVFGQLGTGSNLKSSRPVQVFGLPEKIISISTSYFHNLALASSNRLYTWGSSPQVLRLQAQAQKKARFQFHQQQQAALGRGGSGNEESGGEPESGLTEPSEGADGDIEMTKTKPHFKLAPTSRFVSMNSEMVVSPSTEYKGLLTGRTPPEPASPVSNGSPAVGPPGTLVGVDDGLSHLSPTLVDTSHVEGRITKISCGCHHSALLTDSGQIYTWGRNLDAQLGNGARTKEALHPTYIAVGNTSELVTVECGGDFTISIEANGKVWGWGSNQVGQLGKMPIEDASRAGLEGRLLMLKTSKRVIKIPHGSLNTFDTPKEVPSLPTIQIAFESNLAGVDITKPLVHLSQFENPPHGCRTLHYALSYFHGFYDTRKFREKCVEFGDYQTASKLAMLDKQFDVAMSYQLQAALASSESCRPPSSVTSSQPSVLERASKAVVSTEVIVPTLEASLTVNSCTARKIGISRTKSSLTEVEGTEPEPSTEVPKNGEKSQDKPTDEGEEKSSSEIHTFAVQGGAEEMSLRSQDTLCSKSDNVVESRCDTPDTLASSGCDDFVTKSSEIFDSPIKNCCLKTVKNGAGESFTYETIVNKHIQDLEQNSMDSLNSDHVNNTLIEDLVHIVEFYIDLCEQGPQTSLKALLKQGLEFWTDHKLPVCRLEALLLSHWSLVSYPLGLLLLGNDSEVCVDAQQMLNSLSTDFSLQLCSAMENHVTDRDNNVPEVMELLSGLSWADQTATSITSEPLSFDQIISQISCQQPAQPYIDINFSVPENELVSPSEVISFSCGHKYDGNAALHKVAAGAARCVDDRSLPHTAQALRSLYQQPLVVRHFACPTCILGCVSQELG